MRGAEGSAAAGWGGECGRSLPPAEWAHAAAARGAAHSSSGCVHASSTGEAEGTEKAEAAGEAEGADEAEAAAKAEVAETGAAGVGRGPFPVPASPARPAQSARKAANRARSALTRQARPRGGAGRDVRLIPRPLPRSGLAR
ncbi:hypothetical protein DTL70_00295 [Streptomyces diacarni]|uniref:Uncharacterized protein n=1 Tax=Streptomyces diacarni TaxID=2800381 RepID=A0A367FH47_9ACTN|nr:hypothetical protein [Streptomyces diacarni]RCG29239.1 hypothetical protein DTL70_00295 [Streptomyces diacarni]